MVKPLTEVSCAIIMDGEMVLVTQRSPEMPHPLKWEFPGGKMKAGETPETCIIREISEELGVEITVRQLLPSVLHNYGHMRIKLIPFVCTIRQGDISLSEHRSYRWVHRSELKQIDWLEADMEVLESLNRYH
ncbi:MAG: (deoxy)nucleoside triphosphate pyrophosphohydrolase [Bacteroidales bacterium]|nr:(deoxy)nucleoside triphosphate pyrophosphohydrolase [Bacteroidales bacterium]